MSFTIILIILLLILGHTIDRYLYWKKNSNTYEKLYRGLLEWESRGPGRNKMTATVGMGKASEQKIKIRPEWQEEFGDDD